MLTAIFGARLQFEIKDFNQLLSRAMTSHRTWCKRRNKSQSKAGDRELHSRGSGEVMTALMAGEVSSLVRLGSCLWLMESRDCLGISLVHLNISMYYKCSQKNERQEFSGLTSHQAKEIRSMGFLKCRDGSRQICESLNLDPFGLFLECLVERKCHFRKQNMFFHDLSVVSG